jgi:glucosamine 6-phosphate synthetase-like amidotransferase/phosphosugar isomerase protein
MGSPAVLEGCLAPEGKVQIDRAADKIAELNPEHIFLTGTGSSRFAGMVTEQALNELAGLPATVHSSTEFMAYPPVRLGPESIVIATSHSGVTPGDVRMIDFARSQGAYTFGITNDVNSDLAGAVHQVIIGPDTPILRLRTTRSYNGNIFRGLQLSIALGKRLGREARAQAYEKELENCPSRLDQCLKEYAITTSEMASVLLNSSMFFCVAAGPNMSTAYETALGFYQGSGAGARALQVEEYLHGSIQAITTDMCFVGIASPGLLQKRILEALGAARCIGTQTLVIAPEETPGTELADIVIAMPAEVPELLTPLIYTGPLWQIGYYFSIHKGRDPDYMLMDDLAHKEALAELMPEGSQFDRWAGRMS